MPTVTVPALPAAAPPVPLPAVPDLPLPVVSSVASLPAAAVAEPRVHDALARHRLEIAGLGTAALVAVALALLLA